MANSEVQTFRSLWFLCALFKRPACLCGEYLNINQSKKFNLRTLRPR